MIWMASAIFLLDKLFITAGCSAYQGDILYACQFVWPHHLAFGVAFAGVVFGMCTFEIINMQEY